MKTRSLLILFIVMFLSSFVRSEPNPLKREKQCQIEKIFPNPIMDCIFMKIDAEKNLIVDFELIDILGQTVQEWKPRKIVQGKQQIRLDIDDHHSGIYLLRANIGKEKMVFRVRKG